MYTERMNAAFLWLASSCKMAVLMLCQKSADKTNITVEDESQSILLLSFRKPLMETSGGHHPFPCFPIASKQC